MNQKEITKLAGIDVGDEYEVLRIHPKHLLTPLNYVDILAKYMYGKARLEGKITPWVENLYAQHLLVHNKLFDGRERVGAESFKKSFGALLNSIGKEGFSPEKSIIPVSYEMTLLDGAHRVAAALVYDKNVVIVKTRSTYGWRPGWTWEDFSKRGLAREFLDQVALQWCKLVPEARIAIVFPIVKEKYAEVRRALASHTIYYEKEISLGIRGIGNLIAQMYKPKDWLNPQTRDRHAIRRFVEGEPIRVLLLKPRSSEVLTETKTIIREMLGQETLPIHTADDHEETIRVAEQVFNDNSLHFFNNADPTKFDHFLQLFERYKGWIEGAGYDKDEFCVDGGAVLAVHGLRDCTDLDYISFRDIRGGPEEINSHNDFLYLYNQPFKELIFDPRNYFYYDGYKFLAPERVIEMKRRRRDPQDGRDIELLAGLHKKSSAYKKLAFIFTPENVWNRAVMHGAHTLWRLYVLLPRCLRPYVLKTYHLIKKIYQFFRKIAWGY